MKVNRVKAGGSLGICTLVALAASLLDAAACSDEAGATPADQCNALEDRVCAKMVDCGMSPSITDCRATMAPVLPACGGATAVGATFDDCMTDVATIGCPAFTPTTIILPDSCNGVIVM